MPNLPTADLLAALNWRYATKRFDPTKHIPEATWAALEQSLILAPSSMGLQPWKFFVVRDPALRQTLVPATYGQTQPVDCSHYVVMTYHHDLKDAHIERYLARMREVRGVTEEAQVGHKNSMYKTVGGARASDALNAWQSKQVFIALGQFLTAAALLGVDTCPMEGFDKAKYDEILGLKALGLSSVVCCAAGYRAADDKYAAMAKVRFHAHEVVTYL